MACPQSFPGIAGCFVTGAPVRFLFQIRQPWRGAASGVSGLSFSWFPSHLQDGRRRDPPPANYSEIGDGGLPRLARAAEHAPRRLRTVPAKMISPRDTVPGDTRTGLSGPGVKKCDCDDSMVPKRSRHVR